jgi:hypothetical protein
MHRTLRPLPLVIAAASLLAPAAAHAATKKTVYPKVSSVAPLKVKVGAILTIKGSGFRAGKGKTTVVFQRTGKPAVFVKATTASKTKLTVRIPEKLGTRLAQRQGAPTATRFKLRVLTTRFARSWTTSKTSPTISPKLAPAPAGGAPTKGGGPTGLAPVSPSAAPSAPATAPTPPPTTAAQQCAAAALAAPAADGDGDGLDNAKELGLKFPTDPCDADSDGDGITDGYEYNAAKDLNGAALPYPGSAPWPNPLDPTDASDDFDGDGLSLAQEFHLWKFVDGHFPIHAYSDGTQNTGGTQAVTSATEGYDLDGDDNLTDDERDADGDGLSNQTELNYTGTQKWWNLKKWWRPNPPPPVIIPPATTPPDPKEDYVETPYSIRHFSDLDAALADSDGDGIQDGLDDQDNDGVDNFTEMQLGRNGTGLRVQPYNPCLPNPHAPTCSRYIPLDAPPWPPFDTTQTMADAIPFGWNSGVTDPSVQWDPPMASVFTGPWDGRGGPLGS